MLRKEEWCQKRELTFETKTSESFVTLIQRFSLKNQSLYEGEDVDFLIVFISSRYNQVPWLSLFEFSLAL